MPQIFISYSRVDSAFVERLMKRIQQAFPHLKLWHDQSPNGLSGGDNWWNEILRAVAESDVFVYVLSNESVKSPYCQAEFTEARRLQKRVITIQARDNTELTDELGDIQFIDMKNGVDDADAISRLYATIGKQLGLAKVSHPLWKSATPKPGKETAPTRTANAPDVQTPPLERPSAEEEALRVAKRALIWQIISVAVSVVSIIIAVVAIVIPLLDRDATPTPTTVVQVSDVPSNTPPPTATDTSTPTSVTATPTIHVTATSTANSSVQQLQTAQMELTQSVAILNELSTLQAQQTSVAETRIAIDLTATENGIRNANATAAAVQSAFTETAFYATRAALSATPTPSLTPTSSVPLQYIGTLPANALLLLQGTPNTNVIFEFETYSPVQLNNQVSFPADNALGRESLVGYQLSGRSQVLNGRAICITNGEFRFAAMEGQKILLRCRTNEDGTLALTLDDNLLWNNEGQHSFIANVPMSIIGIAIPTSKAELYNLLNDLLVNVDPMPLAAATMRP